MWGGGPKFCYSMIYEFRFKLENVYQYMYRSKHTCKVKFMVKYFFKVKFMDFNNILTDFWFFFLKKLWLIYMIYAFNIMVNFVKYIFVIILFMICPAPWKNLMKSFMLDKIWKARIQFHFTNRITDLKNFIFW
jgi:hypothetical protein